VRCIRDNEKKNVKRGKRKEWVLFRDQSRIKDTQGIMNHDSYIFNPNFI